MPNLLYGTAANLTIRKLHDDKKKLEERIDLAENRYVELLAEYERRGKLLRWADPYLENWLEYLEDNTAKDVDDLVELIGKIKAEHEEVTQGYG